MTIWLVFSAILGAIVFVSCIGALLVFPERFDRLDRLAVGGLAGAMLLTTPALWLPTPFDPWSFNLSRSFLAMICVKRFAVPVVWDWFGRRRQKPQIQQSAGRVSGLRDRLGDKL